MAGVSRGAMVEPSVRQVTTPRGHEDIEPDDRRRSAPAVARNREPIASVLAEWLPAQGLILEVASGSGEHALAFAQRFPHLEWQPSDPDPTALASIEAWQHGGAGNLRPPLALDAAAPDWPVARADAILCINMAHISPWTATLGLLDGSANLLEAGGALVLYGPWLQAGVPIAPSNVAFDQSLKERDPAWGLRSVEDLEGEAAKRGFALEQVRKMPANNLMLLLRFLPPDVEPIRR